MVSMTKSTDTTPDFSAILDRSHENKWVALTADYSRVLAASASLGDLMGSISDPDAVFYRVLPREVSFAPTIFQGA